jgi:hypothetical protein
VLRRRKRSRAAKRGWNTHTRREGVRQLGKAIAGRHPVVSSVRYVKDLAIGGYKTVDPRGYRHSKIAKKVDKYI